MRTIGDFSTALALIQREAKPYQPQPIRAGNSSVEITAEQKLAAIQKAAKAAAASAKAMPPSEDAAD